MNDGGRATSDAPITVLVCDDLAAMRMLLKVTIEDRPTLRVVGEADDGLTAIAEAKRLQPDVVLLDLSMPGQTGLDAIPELRRVAPDSQIIVFSGFLASSVADEVIALGAARYIEKGSDPDVILDTIEAAGRSNHRRD